MAPIVIIFKDNPSPVILPEGSEPDFVLAEIQDEEG